MPKRVTVPPGTVTLFPRIRPREGQAHSRSLHGFAANDIGVWGKHGSPLFAKSGRGIGPTPRLWLPVRRVEFPSGIGCTDPRTQKRGHPSISPFNLVVIPLLSPAASRVGTTREGWGFHWRFILRFVLGKRALSVSPHSGASSRPLGPTIRRRKRGSALKLCSLEPSR